MVLMKMFSGDSRKKSAKNAEKAANAQDDLEKALIALKKKKAAVPTLLDTPPDKVASTMHRVQILDILEKMVLDYDPAHLASKQIHLLKLKNASSEVSDGFGEEYIPSVKFSPGTKERQVYVEDETNLYSQEERAILKMPMFNHYKNHVIQKHRNIVDQKIRERVVEGELQTKIPRVLEIAKYLVVLNYFMRIALMGSSFTKDSFVKFILSGSKGSFFKKTDCQKHFKTLHRESGGCEIMHRKTAMMRNDMREFLNEIGVLPADIESLYDDDILKNEGYFYAYRAVANIWDFAEKNKEEFLGDNKEEVLDAIISST